MTDSAAQPPRLLVEGRPGGPLETMSYAVTDVATGQWALVDPVQDLLEIWADRLAIAPPEAVFITHGHFDHIGGLADVRRAYPDVPVWVHAESRPMLADVVLNGAQWCMIPCAPGSATDVYAEGDRVRVGGSQLEIFETPGHCPGSVVLYCAPHLLAGDVLFQGSVGRWDLPGASYEALTRSIRDKVMVLPDQTHVYPGHGPATTIGQERRSNPIVREMLGG